MLIDRLTEAQTYQLSLKTARKVAPIYGAKPREMANHLTAIARVESNNNPLAKNKHSTARGLMQMLICTQREVEKKYADVIFAPAMYNCKQYPQDIFPVGLDKMFDPVYSIFLAAHYLGYQFRRYSGSWNKAVWAYNQGSYNPDNSGGKGYLALTKKHLDNKQFTAVPKRREFY